MMTITMTMVLVTDRVVLSPLAACAATVMRTVCIASFLLLTRLPGGGAAAPV
jgi:hypothetical protein